MAYAFSKNPGNRLLGYLRTTTAASQGLTAAYVHYTSGVAVGCRFVSPVTQTNATLTVHAWCSAAVTGSPTDVRCVLRNGPQGTDDIQRPEAADNPLATSAAVDMSAVSAAGWVTFTLSSASLTAGLTYFLLLDNRTGTPASNYPTFATRALIGTMDNFVSFQGFGGVYTTNGYSTDGTTEGAAAAMVVKYDDGTLIGCPYVVLGSHASNTNARGICFTPSEDLVVSGIGSSISASNINGVKLRINGGADVVTSSGDRWSTQGCLFVRFTPVTLTGGTRYDVLLTFSANSTAMPPYTMGGGSPPADVQACIWPGAGYVDNTTVTAQEIAPMFLIVDDNPAVSSGAGAWMCRSIAGGV